MPSKLIIHLICLLGLFILLNAGVKWILIPELNSHHIEKQKKYQEDFGVVLMDMPLLGDYIDGLNRNIEKNNKLKIDKKSLIYAIDQQFKDQFQYFLQKQILAYSQVLVKKDADIPEKTSYVNTPKKNPEFSPSDIDKAKNTKKDSTPAYFKELSEQLSAAQIETILNSFQEHIKKLKPIFTKMDMEVLQYDKVIPEAIMDSENFLTDFHYQLKENNEIHLAFLILDSKNSAQTPNLSAMRGIKTFYRADTSLQKTTSLLSHINAPAVDWKTIKSQFPGEKGQRHIAYTETTEVLQMWHWQQPGGLTVLELYWPVTKGNFSANILYDFVLLFFLILMGIWFYFYHDSQAKEKNHIQLPAEVSKLKEEKKQLEKLLIDMAENQHKKPSIENKPAPKATETIFQDDTKKSYLLPTEQSYIDSKIDFQKDSRDILMEESRTEILKNLIKQIREGK